MKYGGKLDAFFHLNLLFTERNKIKKCVGYRYCAVAKSTLRKWFSSFKNRNCELDVRKSSCKPTIVHDDQFQRLINNNSCNTTLDMTDTPPIS